MTEQPLIPAGLMLASTPTVPLVFLDTETTHLDRTVRRIWDLAMIRREPDGTETRWEGYVDACLELADPVSLSIGRYHQRHPHALGTDDRVYTEREAAQIVTTMTAGAHLIGAVPSFDEETLWALLTENGFLPTWHYHLGDVENMAAGALGYAPPWDTTTMTMALGLNPDDYAAGKHTAMGDAEWARAMYDAVMTREPAL